MSTHWHTERSRFYKAPHTPIHSLWTLLGSVAWHYGAVCQDLNPSCKDLGVCYSCSLPKVLTYNLGVSPGSVYWLQGGSGVFSVMSVSAWIQHVPRLMFIVRSSVQSVMWGRKAEWREWAQEPSSCWFWVPISALNASCPIFAEMRTLTPPPLLSSQLLWTLKKLSHGNPMAMEVLQAVLLLPQGQSLVLLHSWVFLLPWYWMWVAALSQRSSISKRLEV